MNTDNPIHRQKVSKEFLALEAMLRRDASNTQAQGRIKSAIASNYYFESQCAIVTIKGLGPKGAFAVNDLIAVFNVSDRVNRREAALALGEIGPAAAPAVPILTTVVRDESGDVAWFAADALGNIGINNPSVIDALEYASTAGDAALAESAAKALQKLRKVRH